MGIEDKITQILKRIFEQKGSETEAAKTLGVGNVTLHNWLNPRSANPKTRTLFSALDRVGVRLVEPDENLIEYDLIPKARAKAGAGGSLEVSAETEGLYAFRKDWLGMKNIHAAKAVLFDVVGDSMEPLLKEGDTLLIDKNATEIMDGHVYVVTLGEELKVKRIYRGLNGIILRSDNQRYPDVNVEGPDLETLQIWGRVRWVGKEL